MSLKKLFIVPYFGEAPEWIDRYRQNCKGLKKFGFDWLVYTDETGFSQLVREKLGVTVPKKYTDRRKPCEFRPALGVIFDEYIKGYDFWGHTDLDVVYGRLDKFVSDEFLADCDVFANDPGTVCGPFSLFRRSEEVNQVFRLHPNWREVFEDSEYQCFDEIGFSETLNQQNLKIKYRFWQSHDDMTEHFPPKVRLENGSLYDGAKEIMMFHFRRTKKWPLDPA